MGAPQDLVERWHPDTASDAEISDTLPVLEENWPALQLFCALETQWRTAGIDGMATGIDYAAVEPVARLLSIAVDADLMARLRVLERTTIAELRRLRAEARRDERSRRHGPPQGRQQRPRR
ncbi:MAG: DUF1799 domain-containing protein [Alphaproteobacteria bacterium]